MLRRPLSLAAAAATLLVAGSLAVATASGDVSHKGWPPTVTVWFAGDAGGHGVGTNGNDMLLGGPGDDAITGGAGDDIIWGDRYPYPKNTGNQTDVLTGGAGNDWIYASHGDNTIDAGPGDDHVFAYFGHGTIDCGPGDDVLTLDRTTQHAFTVVNCETVTIGYP